MGDDFELFFSFCVNDNLYCVGLLSLLLCRSSCQILTKTKTAIYVFYGVRERGSLWPDLNHEDQNLPTEVGSPFKPIDIFIVKERKNENYDQQMGVIYQDNILRSNLNY